MMFVNCLTDDDDVLFPQPYPDEVLETLYLTVVLASFYFANF